VEKIQRLNFEQKEQNQSYHDFQETYQVRERMRLVHPSAARQWNLDPG